MLFFPPKTLIMQSKMEKRLSWFSFSCKSVSLTWISKPYMPYLTLWDKISQNLADLEANSCKILQISEFSDQFTTRYKEINIYHTLLCLSQASYIKIKAFGCFGGSPKWFLWKSHRILSISLKNLPDLTDFNPQLMARMQNWHYETSGL